MFRGFRWQLPAFIFALVLFAAAVAYRASQTSISTARTSPPPAASSPTPPPTETPSPTAPALPSVGALNPGTYREGMVGGVQRLNPIFAHLNPIDHDISSLIFEGLYQTNAYGEPVPRLAADVRISSDHREYVVTLREDVKWQDGIAFTAADVLYTMALLSAPEYADFSPLSQFWQTVETQKLTDYLVRFRLAQPLGSFTALLTIGILPEHALKGTAVAQLARHPFNLSPIGTGPYQLSSLRSADGSQINAVHLRLAPVYGERPEGRNGYLLDTLQFKLYQSAEDALQAYRLNQIDALANAAARGELMTLPNSQVYTQVEPSLCILILNWADNDYGKVFADRRVRQALSLGLNQQELVQRHFASNAAFADSPFILGAWAYQPNPIWANVHVEQAAKLLESAGFGQPDSTAGDAPESLPRFSLLVEDEAALRALASDIAAQWQLSGFQVTVETAAPSQLINRLEAGDFQAAIVRQQIGSDADVYRYWHPSQRVNGQNYGAASNNEISELLENARREPNGIHRVNLYRQFQETFAEQAIAIPLYYPLYTFIVRDVIEGIRLGSLGTAADRFRGIQHWRPAALAG